jgi:carbamoyltransferase
MWKRLIYQSAARSSRLDRAAHRHFFRKWSDLAISDHHRWTKVLHEGLSELGLENKLQRFHHHDTHAANAFFASGYEQALLVTLDGYGSGCCGGIYTGGPDGLKMLHRFAFPNSLGIYYEQVTSALGFTAGRHEGKIVGLAAYGNPEHLRQVLLDRFEVKDGDIRIRASLNHFFTRALAQRFAKRDIAAAYQQVLEDVTQQAVSHWVKETGLSQIAVSGGVHANVKLNQRIREIKGVDSVFAYPNMGDGGCATGAAMLVFEKKLQSRPVANVYYGPGYSDQEIESALVKEKVEYTEPADIENQIADLLTKNHIVARFHGRMEYGPRALGNRSILYPAQDPEVNQWLNHQLGRTEFMPFAPAVLAEEARSRPSWRSVTASSCSHRRGRCPSRRWSR